MIYVTGDIHANHSIRKLGFKAWPEGRDLTRDDFLIILGDFGLVWYEGGNSADDYWLDWLESKQWTTLFVDGNHENHALLGALPERDFCGGRVHVVRPHVLHLMRGHVFDLPCDGKTVSALAMGGAGSHDIAYRTEGKDWWPDEIPSAEERARCESVLDACHWRVDHVFTHAAPARFVKNLGIRCSRPLDADEFEEWLEGIAMRLSYGHWWFGHYHIDANLDERHHVRYDDVERIA
ncbi:MAG: metallophosphoesterase [Olsenella sp.]|nr:metallophosphoesterase [Olsenella sp.]